MVRIRTTALTSIIIKDLIPQHFSRLVKARHLNSHFQSTLTRGLNDKVCSFFIRCPSLNISNVIDFVVSDGLSKYRIRIFILSDYGLNRECLLPYKA